MSHSTLDEEVSLAPMVDANELKRLRDLFKHLSRFGVRMTQLHPLWASFISEPSQVTASVSHHRPPASIWLWKEDKTLHPTESNRRM